MSLVMNSYIKITRPDGKYYEFENRVNSVRITSTWKAISDTAEIKLPYLRGMLDKQINVGDRVVIYLGYNGVLKQEFKGYISVKKPDVPFTLICEDEMWKLKQIKVSPTGWSTIKLADVITHLAPDVVLTDLPDITLSPWRIENDTRNVAQALDRLRHDFGLAVYFRDGRLYAGLPYYENAGEVKFRFGVNAKDRSLEFKREADIKLQVKAISLLPSGKHINETVGDVGGEQHTLHFYNLTRDELKRQAAEKLPLLRFDGFRGSFLSFGIPQTKHSMVANLEHPRYPEKNGKYFIDTVTTEYNGSVGYKRINELGRKAS